MFYPFDALFFLRYINRWIPCKYQHSVFLKWVMEKKWIQFDLIGPHEVIFI